MSRQSARLPGSRPVGPKKRQTQARPEESSAIRGVVANAQAGRGSAAAGIAMLGADLRLRGQDIAYTLAYYQEMGTKRQRGLLTAAARSGELATWMLRRGFDVHLIDWLLPSTETAPMPKPRACPTSLREPEHCDNCGKVVGYYDPSLPEGEKIIITRPCYCWLPEGERRP